MQIAAHIDNMIYIAVMCAQNAEEEVHDRAAWGRSTYVNVHRSHLKVEKNMKRKKKTG